MLVLQHRSPGASPVPGSGSVTVASAFSVLKRKTQFVHVQLQTILFKGSVQLGYLGGKFNLCKMYNVLLVILDNPRLSLRLFLPVVPMKTAHSKTCIIPINRDIVSAKTSCCRAEILEQYLKTWANQTRNYLHG